MKGLELPVNTLVVIAIAVLVMLGLVAMYMAGTGPFTVVVEMSARGASCNMLTSSNCQTPLSTIAIEFGEYTSLYDYCESKYISHYGASVYNFEEEQFCGSNSDVKADIEKYCKSSFVCGCPGITFVEPSESTIC
jgi:hypothetical protein